MLIVFIVSAYPFLFVINSSFSAQGAIPSNPLLLIPTRVSIDSYKVLFSDVAIYRALLVSLSRSILGPIGMMVVNGMAGYALSKKDLVAGKFLRMLMFFTMYFTAGLIPVYLLLKGLGLTGSYWVYIVPNLVAPFSIVLIKAYIESIPESLEEAVLIDGGNEFVVYWAVLFRVCLPVNTAVFLFSAIGHWNSFIDTQLYNAMQPHLYTMQYILFNTLAARVQSLEAAQRNAQSGGIVQFTPQSLRMAITVITVVPVMFFYPILQRYFVSGIMTGSIKA